MALEELLNKLQDRMYINKKSDNHIFTPFKIAKEMIEALPDDIWNSQTTFLDICCKSGIFLYLIYEKLMNSIDMIKEIPDEKDRKQYIIEKQLFGICPDTMCKLASTRILCGEVNANCNIVSLDNIYTNIITNTDKSFLYETLEREFNGMKRFGVVIGNPPYNRGWDIDFVDTGFKLADKYVCMITPAKWQTAEADQKIASKMSYGEFRQKIVPHMSKVVFYPDCADLFDIRIYGGISYFIMDKDIHINCEVINICNTQPNYAYGTEIRNITNGEILNNLGKKMLDSINRYTKLGKMNLSGRYQVWITDTYDSSCNGSCMFRKDGKTGVLCPSRIIDSTCETNGIGTARLIFSSDILSECESFMSWLYCKFTRFFILLAVDGFHIGANMHYYRFVPAPPSGKFDHIYTDKELYEAFNLPQKYIDVIESVIKERK